MTLTADSLFKFGKLDGSTRFDGPWPLPTQDAPGEWLTVPGPLDRLKCLHLSRLTDLVRNCAPVLYLAECQGERIEFEHEIGASAVRLVSRVDTWNEKTIRLWACDCAERVAEGDEELMALLAVGRQFVAGKASKKEMLAARDAAWSISYPTADRVRHDIALAVSTALGTRDVWDAGWMACWAITGTETEPYFDARNRERVWQSARLLQYLQGEVEA